MLEKFQNKYRIPPARLPGYDYRNEGAYFITICTHNSVRYFGDNQCGMMCLSPIGLIAKQFWFDIPNHFPNTSLGAFVVMPDHIHGILNINPNTYLDTNQNSSPPSVNEYFRNLSSPAKSASTIIRAYKSAVTAESRNWNTEFAWQSRFHDHVIRNHFEYEGISHYIRQNPANWGIIIGKDAS